MSAKIKVVEREGRSVAQKIYLIEVIRGMAVTFKHFFRNLIDPTKLYVRHYPEVKPEITPRWRGRHRLTTHEDGSVKCVACFMCQTACPARAISIEAAERFDGKSEKMPVRFEIDLLACIYCGYCVEACPKDAIRMDSGFYTPVSDNRPDTKIGLEQLMATPAGYTEEEYRKWGM